jgi:RNA polymerase sigma-54 factor
LKLTLEEVHQAAKLIATLEPKPGRAFSPESPRYIQPDVLVEFVESQYRVLLNNADIPGLRISKQYYELMRAAGTAADVKDYLKERIRAGLFLIKSIAQRQQTLYRVADAIVKAQKEFLEFGLAHLKPLTMSEVARAVGLHETTICRCIANKHLQTPRGLFEMKYFFTPGLKTADGNTMSNRTVQEKIAELIARENPEHPLSDQELVEKLKEQGITIARRTVAKYRIALKLLPSHLRKSG